MNPTDMSERGLETLIVESLTGRWAPAADAVRDNIGRQKAGYLTEQFYIQGDARDYDRDHAIDFVQLLAFLNTTQQKAVETLGIAHDGPARTKFLHRLQGEIANRAVADVLRVSSGASVGLHIQRCNALLSGEKKWRTVVGELEDKLKAIADNGVGARSQKYVNC